MGLWRLTGLLFLGSGHLHLLGGGPLVLGGGHLCRMRMVSRLCLLGLHQTLLMLLMLKVLDLGIVGVHLHLRMHAHAHLHLS